MGFLSLLTRHVEHFSASTRCANAAYPIDILFTKLKKQAYKQLLNRFLLKTTFQIFKEPENQINK